jgi:hypothetical protein
VRLDIDSKKCLGIEKGETKKPVQSVLESVYCLMAIFSFKNSQFACTNTELARVSENSPEKGKNAA